MAKTLEVFFEPVDNARLAKLCGVLDENLRQIENAFDITVSRRGEHFTLAGHPAQVLRGEMALKHFYALADKDLSRDEVQLGLIEIASKGEAAQPAPVLLTRRIELHGRTPRQVDYLRNIQDFDITFGIGPAGTGKTYLAVASAVDAFERDLVERIILTRPAVAAGGENLGFLPGKLEAKIAPWAYPIIDVLEEALGKGNTAELLKEGTIRIETFQHMRGRTYRDSFVILDEAQNTTPDQMQLFLTRIGEGSRLLVNGDIRQKDLKGDSGLGKALRLIDEYELPIPVIEFGTEDIVRSGICKMWVEAFLGLQPTPDKLQFEMTV